MPVFQVSVESPGHVLARGLPQVRLLRLQARRGRLHPLHQRKPHSLQKRLSQVRQQGSGCGEVATALKLLVKILPGIWGKYAFQPGLFIEPYPLTTLNTMLRLPLQRFTI